MPNLQIPKCLSVNLAIFPSHNQKCFSGDFMEMLLLDTDLQFSKYGVSGWARATQQEVAQVGLACYLANVPSIGLAIGQPYLSGPSFNFHS